MFILMVRVKPDHLSIVTRRLGDAKQLGDAVVTTPPSFLERISGRMS